VSTRRRRIWKASRLLAVIWLAWCALGCPASLVLPANHDVVHAFNAEQKILMIQGKTVECWIARSPGARASDAKAYVLFFVGKGDRADRWVGAVANAWADKPVEVWGMNYPGSGASADGWPRLGLVAPDAVGVFDQIQSLAAGRPIFIHAGSFGTATALCVAARRPVSGMVLQNPPPLRQLILGRYGWWNLWLIAGPVALSVPSELDSLANAAHTKSNAIFILAGRDSLVPSEYQQKVVQAYAGEKRLVQMPWADNDSALTAEAASEFAKDLSWRWDAAMH
jgi:hypothetical protein